MAGDLQLARNICADVYEASGVLTPEHRQQWAGFMRQGAYDDDRDCRVALKALEMGKQIARQQIISALGLSGVDALPVAE